MNQQASTGQLAHIYGSGRADGQERIHSGTLLLRLLRYLVPFRLQLMWVLVLVIISSLVQALGPALIARAIDVNISQKNLPGLTETMLLLLGGLHCWTSVTVRARIPDWLGWSEIFIPATCRYI
jgi:hypothetical protein